MRVNRPPSPERSLHLAAWSMLGAVALFVAVTATLVPVLVWSMAPPGPLSPPHMRIATEVSGVPFVLLLVAGFLAVSASMVVFGVAAAFLRSPQVDPVTTAAAGD